MLRLRDDDEEALDVAEDGGHDGEAKALRGNSLFCRRHKQRHNPDD
jgi:hypothetical protein